MPDPTPTPPTSWPARRWPAATMVGVLSATILAGLVGAALGLLRDPAGVQDAARGEGTSLITRVETTTRRWQETFEARSPLATRGRPPVQAWLAGWPRVGTGQVIVGRGGWLYYRPALEHLTGPPLLAPDRLALVDRHADPRPAIVDFASQLHTRGIELVIVPVPVKAALEPEPLGARASVRDLPLVNPSLAALIGELERAGVHVFDPGPVLAELKQQTGSPVFLATDTHWRPEAAKAVAAALAAFVRERIELDEKPDPELWTESETISGRGDLAAMLGLPPQCPSFPAETVTIEKVIDADDRLWRLDTAADVLLLGDSFANIYSQPGLGWGEAAGLPEHLSLALGRALDVIARNDSAAWATRALLARELAAGRDRLAGKRVVIWELAARELSAGDWKPIELTLATNARAGFFVPESREGVAVSGVITDMGVIPQPRSAPYADYIVALRLSELESEHDAARGREAIVFAIAMREYELTPVASWRIGQRVALTLQPWTERADEYGVFMRGELDDDALMLVEPCFGEEIGS